jgi:hypothetical protein
MRKLSADVQPEEWQPPRAVKQVRSRLGAVWLSPVLVAEIPERAGDGYFQSSTGFADPQGMFFVARQGTLPSGATTVGLSMQRGIPGIPPMLTASSSRRPPVLGVVLWYPKSREKRARCGAPFELWRGEIQTFCTLDRAAVVLFFVRLPATATAFISAIRLLLELATHKQPRKASHLQFQFLSRL